MQLDRVSADETTARASTKSNLPSEEASFPMRVVRSSSRRGLIVATIVGCLAFWSIIIAVFLR